MNKHTKHLFLTVAGFTIRMEFHSTEWKHARHKLISEINQYYKGFITKKKLSEVHATIHFIERLGMEIMSIKQSQKKFINFYELNSKKEIISFYQIGIYQISIILREIIQKLLADNHGFILHASASLFKNKAYIFLGKSGAGKSTSMRLLHDKYKALADDGIIIKKEKGGDYLYQTPFIDKEAWVNKTSIRYKIGPLFFLNKSEKNHLKKIYLQEKITNKLIQSLFTDVKYSKNQMKYILEFLGKSRQYYDLYFRKNKKELIDLLSRINSD